MNARSNPKLSHKRKALKPQIFLLENPNQRQPAAGDETTTRRTEGGRALPAISAAAAILLRLQ